MKKKLRSLLVLSLALAMLLSLSACGDKESGSETPKETARPEMVYTASTSPVEMGEESYGITPYAYTDDGFYGLSYGKVGEGEIPEGVTPEYEGQYDIYGYRIYFVTNEGEMRQLEAYEPLEPMADPGDLTSFYSGSNLDSLFLNNDGELVAVEDLYSGWFDGTEEEMMQDSPSTWEKYRNSSEYYLRTLDETGAEKSCVKIDFDAENSWLDFNRSKLTDEGELVAIGDQDLYVFAPDGSLKTKLSCENWPNGIIKLRDGRLCISAWDDSLGSQALIPVDLEKKAFDKSIKIPDNAWDAIPGDETYDFYYRNGMYLYGYDLETEQETKVLNWLDVDVNGDNVQGVRIQNDGTITGVLNTWRNDKNNVEIIKVYKVPSDSVPQKETLTMAVMYTSDILDKVIDFNRHSDSVRIQLIDYSEFNDYENGEFDAGRTKLLTEVMSGQMPDLIALGQLPYSHMAAKGLLEDLYPYLDSDPELKRDDFFPNVLKALEVNGDLCMVAPSFNVMTLIGATSVVGDKPGWTYADLEAALATMPEGCDPMDMYTTRGDLLQTLLFADLDHYVDWAEGKCYFDSPDFIELLKFVAKFPDSLPDDMEWEDPETRIAQGRQMLTTTNLYSVDAILWNDPRFGEMGCTYIGYPTNNGVGSVMSIEEGYGMSVSCKNKEAAWQFLRSFLTDEAQENVWNIPVSLKAYQAKLDEAMTPEYEKDENGNIRLDENGEKIQVSRGGYWTEDGNMIEIYAMTQEQADKLWEAITTCDKVMNMDTSIFEIVSEQAQAFFSGQKSAEEVARLIQSKANIYVNEQR